MQPEEAAPEAVEMDQWLVDFAGLFREVLGIDTDKHLDLSQIGWDKLQSALEKTVNSDAAMPLFDQAADKFQEVAALGKELPQYRVSQ